jgi:hypothetical protein
MSPITTRVFLGVALILACVGAAFSIRAVAAGSEGAWAALAGVLAVVTSVVSAWGAQRVVELEEDKLSPYAYPHFDTTSRYGLTLFRITNYGGGTAHSVFLEWDEPLIDLKGNKVSFAEESPSGVIGLLMPGQSIVKTVDGHVQFFGMKRKHIYTGTISYEDAKGRKLKHRFIADAEMYRGTPLYQDETLQTQMKLQQLPDSLCDIKTELRNLAKLIEAKRGGESDEA